MKTMKALIVAGLILAVAGSASALSLQGYTNGDPLYFKIVGHTMGVVYPVGTNAIGAGVLDGIANGIPGGQIVETFADSGVFVQEDTWSIGVVTKITDGVGTAEYWLPTHNNTELTMLVYGGQDVEAKVTLALSSTATDFMKVLMYEDDLNDDGGDGTFFFDPSLGSGGRTGPMTYTSVTDGTQILELEAPSYQWSHNLNAVDQMATYNALFFGSGSMYLDVTNVDSIGGDTDPYPMGRDAAQFDTNGMATFGFGGATADFLAIWTVLPPTESDFVARINDPIIGEAIPEPLTMIALFGGITGLSGYIRKRRKG